jgi:hypothetical protein
MMMMIMMIIIIIKRLWKRQTVQIITIIIAATGVIPKCLLDSLQILDLPKKCLYKYAKRSHFRNLPSHKEVYVPVTATEI